jgi:Tfp pilus assembly protein PilO
MSDGILKRLMNEWRLDAIGVSVFIALTLLAYVLQFEPVMRDQDALRLGNAELTEKREQSSRLQTTIRNLNTQMDDHQDAQKKELKLQAPSEINDRLSALSTLASDNGLLVEAVEPGEGASGRRFSTVPIRMNGRGTYPQFVKFIHALRSELPDTAVTDISIGGGGGSAAATFTINLLWYAAPAPAVAKTDLQ